MKQVIQKTEEKMGKSIVALKNEYNSIRAGRANVSVLDKINVDYYGVPSKIKSIASVSVSEARILLIQPYDISALRDIEKAILTSDVGINPTNDGKVIRMVFPQLTEERRKEIVKDIYKIAEESKVSIRSIRRDANDKIKALKKESIITEDDVKDGEKKVQNLTDKFCKEVDTVAKEKEAEIMEI